MNARRHPSEAAWLAAVQATAALSPIDDTHTHNEPPTRTAWSALALAGAHPPAAPV